MFFKNTPITEKAKTFIETAKVVIGLSLKPHEKWLPIFIPVWVAIVSNFNRYPPFAFLVSVWWVELFLIILPLIFLLFYFPFYYKVFFKNITLIDRKYFFNPTNIDEYIMLPELILSKYFVSRFSFKFKLYGNMTSKFRGKRIVMLIRKAPTIQITLNNTKKALDQEYYNPHKEIFYIEQDYELYSSQISFSVYIEAIGAVDTKQLEIYLGCGDFIEKFLKDRGSNHEVHNKNLIHKEKFCLSR